MRLNDWLTYWLRRGVIPCFRIYGKARGEPDWREIDVLATSRRNVESRWPLWRGTCTTWTDRIIAVGWDFADRVLREQRVDPVSREHPLNVSGGRIRDASRRAAAGAPSIASASEILAHECGHTHQAIRLGALYLPVVGSVTLFREGPHWWNHYENDASSEGQFGGIINGTVSAELMERINDD